VLRGLNEHSRAAGPESKAAPGGGPKGDLFPGIFFILVPAVCCGLPFVIGTVALASALARGIVVGVMVALVGSAVAVLERRKSRRRGTSCLVVQGSNGAERGVSHGLLVRAWATTPAPPIRRPIWPPRGPISRGLPVSSKGRRLRRCVSP
jgi:hypothetical protein